MGESRLTAYLAVDGARKAIEWYGKAFGATVASELYDEPGGRVGHVALAMFGTVVFLSDAYPELGVVAPAATGNDVTMHVRVDDADAVVARAAEAGATVARPCEDQPYGRIGVLRDPFGHRWMVNGPVRG